MSSVKRLVDSWVVFTLTLVCLSVYAGTHLWPTSYWLDVESIKAGPGRAGQLIPMAVERTIHRSFLGYWQVSVKRFGVAGWVAYCNASGSSTYGKDAELPQKLDLDWWTDGACQTLPDGRYIVDTTWQIKPTVWGLPEKSVSVRSNIFEVTP